MRGLDSDLQSRNSGLSEFRTVYPSHAMGAKKTCAISLKKKWIDLLPLHPVGWHCGGDRGAYPSSPNGSSP